jgi:DNA-binding XRE family transcriptional regulator
MCPFITSCLINGNYSLLHMEVEKHTQEKVEQLGRRIKEFREKKGYTNAEKFAYEHGISRSQYAQYEKGKDLRFSSLVKLIHSFDTTLDEFFSEGFKDS